MNSKFLCIHIVTSIFIIEIVRILQKRIVYRELLEFVANARGS